LLFTQAFLFETGGFFEDTFFGRGKGLYAVVVNFLEDAVNLDAKPAFGFDVLFPS
jgi:hypothetical protein